MTIPDAGQGGCYFDRAPEKLVLEGYRRWIAGFETGSVVPWEMAWTLYAETLGDREGRLAMGELAHFVRTLRRCAACPLRTFPFNAHHVCRDECLTLGLIAGIQHGDDDAARLCVTGMACRMRGAEVADAAAGFAVSLKQSAQVLLPIPASAIEDVLSRGARGTVH